MSQRDPGARSCVEGGRRGHPGAGGTRLVKLRATTRTACLLAAIAVLSTAAVTAMASGSSAATAASSGALSRSAIQPTATFAWTAAAMAAAKPMSMPAVKAGPTRAGAAARPTGTPGQVAASPTDVTLADEGVAPVSVPAPTSGSFSYPTPFDRYNVPANQYKAFPHAAVGKLFFTQNGGSFVCSASSVGNDAIWTAGHCVSDGAGNFSSNLVFVPAYKNGAAPYGSFSCPAIIVFTAWHNGGDLSRDSGDASCGTSSLGNGRTVQQSVGSLGFAWNQPSDSRHFNVLGYPQAAPFKGALQVQCQSSFGHFDGRQSFSPSTFAVGCDSTGGVSGGPYVMSYRQGNYLNGNASYRYTTPNENLELYTPYFDDASKSLHDQLIA